MKGSICSIAVALACLTACDCAQRSDVESVVPEAHDPAAAQSCTEALAEARAQADAVHDDYRERAGSGTASQEDLALVGDACRNLRVQIGLAEAALSTRSPTSAIIVQAVEQARRLPDGARQRVEGPVATARDVCP